MKTNHNYHHQEKETVQHLPGSNALYQQMADRSVEAGEKSLMDSLINEPQAWLPLLHAFELEVLQLMDDLVRSHRDPAVTLHLFFKQLFFTIRRRPWLILLLDGQDQLTGNWPLDRSFVRIRSWAGVFLSGLIERGKQEGSFRTEVPTIALTTMILSDFRALMQEEDKLESLIRPHVTTWSDNTNQSDFN